MLIRLSEQPKTDPENILFHIKRAEQKVGWKQLAEHEDLYYATCAKLRQIADEVQQRLENGGLKANDTCHQWGANFDTVADVNARDFLDQVHFHYRGILLGEALVAVLDNAVRHKNRHIMIRDRVMRAGASTANHQEYARVWAKESQYVDLARVIGLQDHRQVPVAEVFARLAEKCGPAWKGSPESARGGNGRAPITPRIADSGVVADVSPKGRLDTGPLWSPTPPERGRRGPKGAADRVRAGSDQARGGRVSRVVEEGTLSLRRSYTCPQGDPETPPPPPKTPRAHRRSRHEPATDNAPEAAAFGTIKPYYEYCKEVRAAEAARAARAQALSRAEQDAGPGEESGNILPFRAGFHDIEIVQRRRPSGIRRVAGRMFGRQKKQSSFWI